MYKTTLYLPEDYIRSLKELALETPKKGLTYHIQQAVKIYLASLRSATKKHHVSFLKCKGLIKKSRVADSVSHQRNLRAEWL